MVDIISSQDSAFDGKVGQKAKADTVARLRGVAVFLFVDGVAAVLSLRNICRGGRGKFDNMAADR